MNSISVRLLVAASVVLTLFISITIITMQRAVDIRSEQGQFARLQGQVFAMLGVSDINDDGTVTVAPENLPNPLMAQPVSGEYAEVRDSTGAQIWASPSLNSLSLPNDSEGGIGEWRFSSETSERLGPMFIARFAIQWQLASGVTVPFQYVLASNRETFDRRRQQFNRNIWLAMLSMGGMLLMFMTLILAWGLRPLRRLSSQLREVEAGQREDLPTQVPAELRPLTGGINTLIATERGRRKRYRNTLDDLAHSLKTPLSVIRNIGADRDNREEGEEIQRQTERMEQIVSYHIKRADSSARRLLTAPIALAESTQRVTNTIKKVYRDRNIDFKLNVGAQIEARIEEADWMEIFGNLLDNACKYGATTIHIRAEDLAQRARIIIDDNGPGFPAGATEMLLKRGVRADTLQEGQGIGLAVCRELIENYGGKLQLCQNPANGARVIIELPSGH